MIPTSDLSSESTSIQSKTRSALAAGRVLVGPEVFGLITDKKVSKGDVLTFAEVTGILAAKQTNAILPFARPNSVSEVHIDCELVKADHSIYVQAFTKSTGEVGVQMEALMAVSIACLTVFEMCKGYNKEITITDIGILSKTGGQSGDFRRN